MNELVTIKNVRAYIEKSNGTAFLNLEDVARGLGFTRIANSGNEVVMWSRVEGYLKDLSYTLVCTERKEEFIPENIFYKLCMKANNETARAFQDLVCDEILPTIRKTGGYIVASEDDTDEDIMARAVLIAQKTIERKNEKIRQLESEVSELKPQAMYCKAMLISDGLFAISTIAKDLGFKSATELNKELHRVGVQYKTSKSSPWQLYSKYADKGYAKTIPQPSNTSKGFKTFPHLYWTEAGKKFIYEMKQQGVIQTIAEKRNEVA